MKKKFFTICFTFFFGVSSAVFAGVAEINQPGQYRPAQQPVSTTVSEMLPNPKNLEEVLDFFKNRFQQAGFSEYNELTDQQQNSTIDVQHSMEYINAMQEDNKSTFEKIYDQAMRRFSGAEQNETADSSLSFYELAETPETTARAMAVAKPNIPLVDVVLPGGRKVMAPAREHIPYLLVSYNILPNGLIEVDEEITVVANGQKLKNGLIKMMPKFTTSRAQVRKKLDIRLISVSINNHIIPYVLEEIGDKIYMKPRQSYVLPSGIYTYRFRYLLDRKLWYYDDFTEFYQDVAGGYLNLVITSANAIVSLPNGRSFLGQNLLVGRKGRLSSNRGIAVSLNENALGFSTLTPLLPGEGMHLLVSLDKNIFLEPDLNQRFLWMVTDYGDILFAVLGLASVLLSYILSWQYLKKNKPRLLGRFHTAAPILRTIWKGSFDKEVFVSSLLELYRKNIIDLQKQDNTLMLVKKSDDATNMSLGEKKILSSLFGPHDSVVSATQVNLLKFNRAQNALQKYTKRMIKLLMWQLNVGYLLFSIGMLLLTEASIVYLAINPWQTGAVLLTSTLAMAFYIWLMQLNYSSKRKKYVILTIAALFLLQAILLMSVYIHLLSAIILAAIVYVIFEYSILFSKRNGLIKSKIKEIEELSRYLQTNATRINTSSEFLEQQANIYALGLQAFYPKNERNASSYRLDIAQTLAIWL